MPHSGFQKACELVLAEITQVLPRLPAGQAEALEEALLQSPAVFVTGEGRSGMVGRCFAMRLMHLGLNAHVVGETVTPPLHAGDLLLAISGSGRTDTTVTRARAAAGLGGRVAALTAAEQSPLAEVSHLLLALPTSGLRPAGESAQYGGSLFEQCSLIVLEAIALDLQRRLGRRPEEMDARHATIE